MNRLKSRDAPTYIEVGIVDAFWTVERVIDWYDNEAPLEGPPRVASEVGIVERKNKVSSPTLDLSASGTHRDAKIMESGWL